MMLVYQNGEQTGTLGGGCVEADVKRLAQVALRDRSVQHQQFELDHDFSWDDGLICGGRMDVLIDPLTSEDDFDEQPDDYYRQLQEMVVSGQEVTEVFETGETVETTACCLFDESWKLISSRQLTSTQPPAFRSFIEASLSPGKRTVTSNQFSAIRHATRARLLIVGAGHVGQAVAKLATELDFEVTVFDDRESFVTLERFPKVHARVTGDLESSLNNVPVDERTYCLIVTRGHGHDEQALFRLINRGARYVGMIGSRRKIKMIFNDLVDQGIDPARLAEVHAPVGIDIGSQSVPEIAISIAAELVAHRNLKGQVPGRPQAIQIDRANKAPSEQS